MDYNLLLSIAGVLIMLELGTIGYLIKKSINEQKDINQSQNNINEKNIEEHANILKLINEQNAKIMERLGVGSVKIEQINKNAHNIELLDKRMDRIDNEITKINGKIENINTTK